MKRGKQNLLNAKYKIISLSVKYQKKTRSLGRGWERKCGWGNGGQRRWRPWPMGPTWPAGSDGWDSDRTQPKWGHQAGGKKKEETTWPSATSKILRSALAWGSACALKGGAWRYLGHLASLQACMFGGWGRGRANRSMQHVGLLSFLEKSARTSLAALWLSEGMRGWEKGQGTAVGTELAHQAGRE